MPLFERWRSGESRQQLAWERLLRRAAVAKDVRPSADTDAVVRAMELANGTLGPLSRRRGRVLHRNSRWSQDVRL